MNEKVENNLMVNWYYTGIDLQYSLTSVLACASVNASFRALGAWFQILAVFLVKLSLATLDFPQSSINSTLVTFPKYTRLGRLVDKS